MRDRADMLDRLADACEEQGRGQEAAGYRGEAKRSAATAAKVSQSVSAEGDVLRHTTKLDFGDEGLPLSELPNLAEMLRGTAGRVTGAKTGRNDPCPCGSGKKFKKCCGA